MVTLAVRRANLGGTANILDYIPKGVTLLPNTSGARTAEEAVRIARLAREIGCGDFIKVEVIRDSRYLLPDNEQTVRATELLAKEGFVVMPYMYPDLNVARDLQNAGAAAVMPLAAPIGSNKGLCTREFIQYSHRRDRPPGDCGRRHRPPLAGLRGDGNGDGGRHGQHRHRHGRGRGGDGAGFSSGY